MDKTITGGMGDKRVGNVLNADHIRNMIYWHI